MPEITPRPGSLVLFKNAPARVIKTGKKKIEIQLEDGRSVSVRYKDVALLHPGPIADLNELQPVEGDLETARQLLSGEMTNLEDLAELAYDAYTPASTWTAWQHVDDGLLFSGSPEAICVHDSETVTRIKDARAAKAAEDQAWRSFIDHMNQGYFEEPDKKYLIEVVSLARGQIDSSRILQTLGQSETPENAHALLLSLGYWDVQVNPYPLREGLAVTSPSLDLEELLDEPRRDLTHLLAWAIDDEGSKDPDDAISIEDGRLWVHIADVAAIVPPGCPADIEAQSRAVNLYLPEGTVSMLPRRATHLLALGLADVSPALSFGIDLSPDGEIAGLEIVPSNVRVTRISYEEAEARIEEQELKPLYHQAQIFEKRRRQNGAIEIDLPEVKVSVRNGQVSVRPLERLHSRDMVREMMLIAGEATAHFVLENEIPSPFSVQDKPAGDIKPATTPSEMFARRRTLRPSQRSTTPGLHAGLGMPIYVQCTSPLRRYLDLVVHQQLRAFLQDKEILDGQALMARVGATGAISGSARWAERRSNTHWKLIYLMQHPNWQGDGIVIEKRVSHDVVLIPELDLETRLYSHNDLALDSRVTLALREVDLPNQETHFTLINQK